MSTGAEYNKIVLDIILFSSVAKPGHAHGCVCDLQPVGYLIKAKSPDAKTPDAPVLHVMHSYGQLFCIAMLQKQEQ